MNRTGRYFDLRYMPVLYIICGYGISEAYQNNGYATEAVKAVLEWAFSHPEVIAIEAETESENAASIRVLEKCGFALNGIIGEEGPRWAISRC